MTQLVGFITVILRDVFRTGRISNFLDVIVATGF